MIAIEMKMALSSVHEAYGRGLDAVCPMENLIEARRRQLARLDELRQKVWRRLDVKRPPLQAVAAALAVEERESRLLGTDAQTKYDAANPIIPGADQQAALIQKNLSIAEQRELVRLLRKARDGAPPGEEPPPSIDTTSTPIPPPPAPPERVAIQNTPLPPSTTPNVDAVPDPGNDYHRFCRERQFDPLDPVIRDHYERERLRYLKYRASLS